MNAQLESFYKEYFKYLPEGYDDVFILHANSGEIYVFLAYLAKACIKKSNSTNPLFVATKPYHTDIINLFFPKSRSVYYDMYLKEPRLNLFNDTWEYNGHKFWQIFSQRHFNTVNSNLGSIHYFDAMLNTLGLTINEASKPIVKLPSKAKKNVQKIASDLQLNLDKFVILAPEASTVNLLPTSLWKTLLKELYKNGYDVFLNTTSNKYDFNCKRVDISYMDLFALATYAKGIISLRSGLTEFLIPTKTKNIALCSRFHWSPTLTAEQCIRAYTMMKLPYIDKDTNIEINADLYKSDYELTDKIMSCLKV